MGDPLPRLRLAVVVPFLNEAQFLPRLLASIERQTHAPDELVLVDDGSTDGSTALAAAFAAACPYARLIISPPRPAQADRLAAAGELRAFQQAVPTLVDYDVVAKLDADLELNPRHFESSVRALAADGRLGIVGPHLSTVARDGSVARDPTPPWHVRGATKFYRRECYEAIQPIPVHLGWDMVDEVKARSSGWRTMSIDLVGADTLHLRPTGAHDGRLRAFRRWGECAWGYGAHPLFALLGGVKRLAWRPYVVGGVLYAAGYFLAALAGLPRAEPAVRASLRREERKQVRELLAAAVRPGRAPAATRP